MLLLLGTGSLHDAQLDTAYAAMIVISAVYFVAFIVGLVVAARRRGPNFTAEGRLKTVDGLELVEIPAVGHPITVQDVRRRQTAIEAALAHGSRTPRAVLVPGVGNGFSLRDDIAVYLLSDNGFHHVGRLGDRAQVAMQGAFDALAAQRRFVVVDAVVTGEARPYGVDVRLDGIAQIAPVSAGASA